MLLAIMDAVENIEIVETPSLRVFRDCTNPFEMCSEEEFKQRFRFKKQIVHLLLHVISSDLEHGLPNNNNFIPPILQIAVALRFYATVHFRITDGYLISISQPSVCRIIERVSRAIAERKAQFIKFPTAGSLQDIKRQFKDIGDILGVVGCIDCSHIPISSPGGEKSELFRNRKGYFSVFHFSFCIHGVCVKLRAQFFPSIGFLLGRLGICLFTFNSRLVFNNQIQTQKVFLLCEVFARIHF